jgi:hypothetical protein
LCTLLKRASRNQSQAEICCVISRLPDNCPVKALVTAANQAAIFPVPGWEQGEDPSMIDSSIHTYEKLTKMVVLDVAERKSLAAIGIRPLKRESKLSQAPIFNATKGKPSSF